MNIPDAAEVAEKHHRVLCYMESRGLDAMILGRQDNFAWYTCGGSNAVIRTSETGFAIIVITKEATRLVAHVMDSARIMDEELRGLPIESIPLRWNEKSLAEMATELIAGRKAISDIPIAGASCEPGDVYQLHYPLTEKEIEKYRWIGARTDQILRRVANAIEPGMTEHRIEAMMLHEYAKENMIVDVILVGSDERISKYRHTTPSEKKIEKFVLMHSAVRKWGLHANVTRMVYFGDTIPADILRRYDAACQIEAAAIGLCAPGNRFRDILEVEKSIYAANGFADEWRNHFQGGITGYLLCDPSLCTTERTIVANQAYDWFITLTGVKVEELSINTAGRQEVLSVTGHWPSKTYFRDNKGFPISVILQK